MGGGGGDPAWEELAAEAAAEDARRKPDHMPGIETEAAYDGEAPTTRVRKTA